MSTVVPVFRNQYLSAVAGDATEITSQANSVQGNKAVLAVTVLNSVNLTANELTISLQGSYDGLSWVEFTTPVELSPIAFGYSSSSSTQGELDFAFLRVSARLVGGGSDEKVLFDATIAMTEQ